MIAKVSKLKESTEKISEAMIYQRFQSLRYFVDTYVFYEMCLGLYMVTISNQMRHHFFRRQ